MKQLYDQRTPGEGLIPDAALEIASSETDERVLLFVRGSRRGQVWLKEWATLQMHGHDDPEADLTFVADRFDQFLHVLLDDEDD